MWYKGRHRRPADWQKRGLRLILPPEAWQELERNAELCENSVSFTVSEIVHNWYRYSRKIPPPKVPDRPGVYYDSQGRELEHGDVAAS